MTLESFRIQHSTLIEHYQYIEAHLEGIYAAIAGKSLLDGLSDVESANLYRILREIERVESQKNICVLTNDEYASLRQIIARRNFWCHNCYYDMVFDHKKGGLKKSEDIQKMNSDLREAAVWREKLYTVQMGLFDKNREILQSF